MWSSLKGSSARALAGGLDIVVSSRQSFQRHGAKRLGAGLAYYSLFALVPTLSLALTIVAALFGTEATEGRLVDRLDGVIGTEAAQQVEQAVSDLWENSNTSGVAILTLVVLVYSASVLFVAWRDTLANIWELPYRAGLRTTLRKRVYGAVAPIAVGVLFSAIVLVELLAALAAEFITAPLLDAIVRAIGVISPTAASVIALGLMYRVSTRVRPRWGDIWPGTLVATVALAVLAWGYGLYVRVYGSSSAAGAIGTLLLGLVFVYYSAQILLYGAEIISTTADRRNRPLRTSGGSTESAEPPDASEVGSQ